MIKLDTKVGVLLTYWDKLYGKMQAVATRSHDCNANCFLKKMATVPQSVKIELFREWVAGCKKLHRIAFYQWRLMFPSSVRHDIDEITSCITSECNRLKNLKAWTTDT